jgi:type III restriction enzyme
MSQYEVPEPILNSPYEEPQAHWRLEEGREPEKAAGRRLPMYYYRPPNASAGESPSDAVGTAIELKVVSRIRERMKEWRASGWPGATRTTLELLQYWRRDGRRHRLFFAQLEAAETIIFLIEGRADFRQGINIPSDEPSDERKEKGFRAFSRYACKMATGSGKTTVMGMLAAWSILNKVHHRADARFSDVILVVCPNVTIRSRLQELDPRRGEAGLYQTRDLVPGHMLPDLRKGQLLVTNWHVFEPQTAQVGGVTSRVLKAGVPVRVRETIHIGDKATTARGRRYLTEAEYQQQVAARLLDVLEEERDGSGLLKRVTVEYSRYVESDGRVVSRVLGREIGGKKNILVFNDEAHHAYRIRREEPDEEEEEMLGEEGEAEEFFREATVWVEGLDRVHKIRGINFCVDLSATPYYLGRMGSDTNRIFPWTVSDFGLTDAIESGLVKIPQLAVRDTTGAPIPGYFNIWRWILPKLTPAERGGKKGNPKPEAILKWANTPIVMLGALWEDLRQEWERFHEDDPRPPVFILVCKNIRIAKVVYEWLAENKPPSGIPSANIPGFLNREGRVNTIRVDSTIQESAWMRVTLDTIGKTDWTRDTQGRPIYPEGFEELAEKFDKPLHPPGRDVRCIVSVAMLTEGWDCNTVTHIVGLRPFMSQLLCEQVVGRGLRRTNYELGDNGRLKEEVAKVFGVPFEVVPFKQNANTTRPPAEKRHHVHAVPQKAGFEIRFPRVEGYRQAIRNRITVNWEALAALVLDPLNIPPEVEMKHGFANNRGRYSIAGPGKLERVDLNPYRKGRRLQELIFEMAGDLTRDYRKQPTCEAPAHVLFPQLVRVVRRFLDQKVHSMPPAETLDVFLSPYYGWAIERLVEAILPDRDEGEAPELPYFEANREPGSTSEVDFWTSRDVREVRHSHLNYVVADTVKWEQSAAYIIDRHPRVAAFVKNASLGFAAPYFHNGQAHDYIPDFLIRLESKDLRHVILETKGYDPLTEIKIQAAQRWVTAVNQEGSFGRWHYAIAHHPSEIGKILTNIE